MKVKKEIQYLIGLCIWVPINLGPRLMVKIVYMEMKMITMTKMKKKRRISKKDNHYKCLMPKNLAETPNPIVQP